MSLFFFGTTTYAITRYRLMDIRIFISKSFTYALLLSLLVGFVALVVHVTDVFFARISPAISITSISLIAFVVAMAFRPLQLMIGEVMHHIFAPATPFYRATKQINEVITGKNSLTDYANRLVQYVEKELRVKNANLFLINKLDGNFESSLRDPERTVLNLDDPLVRLLTLDRLPMVEEDIHRFLDDPMIARKELVAASAGTFLRIQQIAAFPVWGDEKELMAILTIGPKLTLEPVTNEDYHWLCAVARDLSPILWKYMAEEEIRYRVRKFAEMQKN